MKNNFLIISILIILAIAVGLLFWHGERTIEKAKDSGTTIVFFNNLSNNLNESALDFTLRNNEAQKNVYKIEYYINDKNVGNGKVELFDKKSAKISPKLNLEEIDENIQFVAKVSWENGKEEIGKNLKINLNN